MYCGLGSSGFGVEAGGLWGSASISSTGLIGLGAIGCVGATGFGATGIIGVGVGKTIIGLGGSDGAGVIGVDALLKSTTSGPAVGSRYSSTGRGIATGAGAGVEAKSSVFNSCAKFIATWAFLKINDRPFVYFFLAFIKYFTKPKLYIFSSAPEKIKPETGPPAEPSAPQDSEEKKITPSKLKELALNLDTGAGRINKTLWKTKIYLLSSGLWARAGTVSPRARSERESLSERAGRAKKARE